MLLDRPRIEGRWARNERGQATVELAALFPVVLLVILVVVQVGFLWRDQLLVVHAAREAARAAAVDSAPGAAQQAARDALDVDPARVTAVIIRREGAGGLVTVEVRLSPLTSVPLFSALLSGRSVSARATMFVEASASRPPFAALAVDQLLAEQGQDVKSPELVQWRVAASTLW